MRIFLIGGGSMARNVVFLLLPRFNMMTLNALLEPMRIANYLSPDRVYDHVFYSFDNVEMTASNGLTVRAEGPPPEIKDRETRIFVMGSWGAWNYDNAAMIAWLRRHHRYGISICAVETASYICARAGVFNRKETTVHWSCMVGFLEQYPETEVKEQLFTIDGKVMSCAGGTAGFDLMLTLIQMDHGERLAGEISDQIMHHPVRPAAAPQRMTHGRGLETVSYIVRDAIGLMEMNISEPMTVPEVADHIGVSQRKLERLFKHTMGCSVVQYSLLMRLQHARVLLIATDMGVRQIAVASGFNSLSHFAYAFKKCFERRPSEYRQAWPENDASPSWPGTLSKFLDSLERRTKLKHGVENAMDPDPV
ncbi:GlxA family transcriptional regulator [Hwanghaeella grinnelliae]|uniref:GlxA family transcriptional regulator n=2 Tax=Hwanghaeella grinnelliae TaxID=2500179 RepID=A0A437QZ98_9PROT|nr:GlxA family transcriptional regulator [Hwanghaeella grinnelliae]